MDFFKSVFSDDPDDHQNSDSQSTPTLSPNSHSTPNPDPNPTSDVSTITNAWTFGSSLFKTLASKSESFVDTYRRDLEEFSSGLKKETAVIREAATRAVKDLPTSLEAGAAAAQESLESVGQAIDNLTDIIAQNKDALFENDDSDNESSDLKQIGGNLNLSSKPYSRLEAQIRGIQCDLNTYCKEVEDFDEFNEWKLGFVLDDMGDEIDELIEENGVIEEIYNEVVPSIVDGETFWCRYFFKVYKAKKAEEVRAKFVKRAISGEEEELTWDVDDDDYEDRVLNQDNGEKNNSDRSAVDIEEESLKRGNVDESGILAPNNDNGVGQIGSVEEPEPSAGKQVVKSDEKITSEGKTDSDISVISSQLSPEEEDLGWDEIEDIGSSDEHKVAAADGSPKKAVMRKRLMAADEEDLTWDIEEDDDDGPKS